MNALPPLVIVADRGSFHAYRSADSARLQPVEALAVPCSGAAERMSVVTDTESRTFAVIVGHITELCEELVPDHWGFAAPTEINDAVLHGLDERWKRRLSVNLDKDLVKVPVQELPWHFKTSNLPFD